MNGLYALKPWYADRLGGVRRRLVALRVPPTAITVAGVGFAGAAGAALAVLRPGPLAGIVVAALLACRLAAANLDGGVARQAGAGARFGAITNEIGDRLADLAALAGCLALVPAWMVAASAIAVSAPSWIALAGAAAGAPRLQGGPVGKTERCVLVAVIAVTGWVAPLLGLMAAGSLATAALRAYRLRRLLDGRAASRPPSRRGGAHRQVAGCVGGETC